MVSGLVTSPKDQLRIFSGEASDTRIELKSFRLVGWLVNVNVSKSTLLSEYEIPRSSRISPSSPFHQLDVEAERLELAHQHVERLRQARILRHLAFDDRLVDLRAAL